MVQALGIIYLVIHLVSMYYCELEYSTDYSFKVKTFFKFKLRF